MHQDRKETPAAFFKKGVVGERKSQWSGTNSALEAAPSTMRAEMLKELAFYGGSLLLPTTPQVFPPTTTLQQRGTYNERHTQGRPERSRRERILVKYTLYILVGIAVMVMLMSIFAGAAFAAVGSGLARTKQCPLSTSPYEQCGTTEDDMTLQGETTPKCGEPLADPALCQIL